MDHPEATLIERIRSGDGDACRTLVRSHYAAIYRLLANLTGDGHRGEDLCQETFAAAWAKIDSFQGHCALRTWLHRIAYRRFLDWRRQRSRRIDGAPSPAAPPHAPPHVPLPPPPPRECPAPTPLAGLVRDEQARALHAALARLGEAERQMLVLHYLQGLSYREIADVTDAPIGTIKWRVSAALRQLRTLLPMDDDHEQARTEEVDRPAARPAAAADPAGA